ncbi:hypothetical protein BT96DRAFT_1016707 [Gymnopus androsaceus JB14]|uniref:F-box domain-containing protein n=1 Tax=Gymnopus androsaceus JB14 TaxID=1447944 RepID=A0A6A4I0L3_9AGAR|nr:hypothetical protein BT96DRAFT_1016707 [Gymnopus androsaceus JB14]
MMKPTSGSVTSSIPGSGPSADTFDGHERRHASITLPMPKFLRDFKRRLLSNPGGKSSVWKNVSRSQPSLWYNLSFTVRSHYPPAEIFTLWLEQSAVLPLDITIKDFSSKSAGHPVPSRDTKYLDCLIPFCERWRSLRLIMDWAFIKHLLQTNRLHLPLLKRLFLRPPTFDQNTKLRSLEDAPSLSYFDCVSSFSPISDAAVYIPAASNITTLKLRGISQRPSSFYSLMQSCPQLRDCELSLPDDFRDSLNSGLNMVELPHLHSLELEFIGRAGCPEFLDKFTLPDLGCLRIEHNPLGENCIPDLTNPLPHLTALVERSESYLYELEFISIPGMPICCFTKCLRLIPSLASLSLVNCSLHVPSLCRVLAVERGDPNPILPELSSLTLLQDPYDNSFTGMPIFTGVPTSVSDFARSRWRSTGDSDDELSENESSSWEEDVPEDDWTSDDELSGNDSSSWEEDVSEEDWTTSEDESELGSQKDEDESEPSDSKEEDDQNSSESLMEFSEDDSAEESSGTSGYLVERLESLVISGALLLGKGRKSDRARLRALERQGMDIDIVDPA